MPQSDNLASELGVIRSGREILDNLVGDFDFDRELDLVECVSWSGRLAGT